MDSDEITERPDVLQGQLLNTEGGCDFWRNDGVIAYSLVGREGSGMFTTDIASSVGTLLAGDTTLSLTESSSVILRKDNTVHLGTLSCLL